MTHIHELFYSRLYKVRPTIITIKEAQHQATTNILNYLNLEETTSLSKSLMLVELTTSIRKIHKSKSFSPNGIILEFYEAF